VERGNTVLVVEQENAANLDGQASVGGQVQRWRPVPRLGVVWSVTQSCDDSYQNCPLRETFGTSGLVQRF
jgi:predicted oxidoreductase